MNYRFNDKPSFIPKSDETRMQSLELIVIALTHLPKVGKAVRYRAFVTAVYAALTAFF